MPTIIGKLHWYISHNNHFLPKLWMAKFIVLPKRRDDFEVFIFLFLLGFSMMEFKTI